jgi:hypothetical protein
MCHVLHAQQCFCPAHRVVPSCYRRNFPAQLKSHRSHDVVLLCFECHQTAHKVVTHAMPWLLCKAGISTGISFCMVACLV